MNSLLLNFSITEFSKVFARFSFHTMKKGIPVAVASSVPDCSIIQY